MLASLYIDNMFKIQDKELNDKGILFPDLINPKRQKLQDFLEDQKNYDPSILLEKVKDSWLTEE